MEEITLWAPGVPENSPVTEPETGDSFATRYRTLARARDRFCFTERGRLRRNARFDLELRTLVKQASADLASSIPDRIARQDARSRIYTVLIEALRMAAEDRDKAHGQARAVRNLSLVWAILCTMAMAAALWHGGVLA